MEPTQPVIHFSSDLQRSRVTVFFRPLLAFPHLMWLGIYGFGAMFVFVGQWFSAVFTGTTGDGTHAFLAKYFAYNTRVQAYLRYLTNDWPPFSVEDPYAATLVQPAQREVVQGRASSFFRGLLAIPALFISFFFAIGLAFTTLLSWFAIMFTGSIPAGFQSFGVRALTYSTRVSNYVWLQQRSYPATIDETELAQLTSSHAGVLGTPAEPVLVESA